MMTLKGVLRAAVVVAALAFGFRWAAETSIIASFDLDILINVPPRTVMDFFVKNPDWRFLRDSSLLTTPWNVVSTVHESELVTQHNITLSESVPVLNKIDFTVTTTCDRGQNVVWVRARGTAWSGVVTLIPYVKYSIHTVDSVKTYFVEQYEISGPRFLGAFHKTTREIAEREHKVMLKNLKKTLEERSIKEQATVDDDDS
ncbi:uncharacterized protein LOC134190074 [Corticium candelabrum]|uniref:uncharacterized protein LOC134190074 n=1 Tax=Corticium candelabrum TaxID=121492 RepID=UPI002E2549CB|nr:uncharacterized protein LOC134190074 [Corticium candelabrum]